MSPDVRAEVNGGTFDRVKFHSDGDPCDRAPSREDALLLPLENAEEKAVMYACSCAPSTEETTASGPRRRSA